MLKYQPMASIPTVPPPAFGLESRFLGQIAFPAQAGVAQRSALELGRQNPKLAQTFDQLLHWPPFMGDTLRLVFHGGTTYLGIRVGLQEKNKVVSSIAWILGVGNGLAAIADVISLIQRAIGTHPPEIVVPPPKAPAPVAAAPGPRSF